jgi:4-hydroxy-tetrahydrodipicolinate synthase
VPVVAGVGSNATAHAIALGKDAEAAGADAILSVVPYYNKPMQAGLLAHFRAVADATGVPVILYDVPSRTITGLADDTVARLAEHPRIIGLKDATGDVTRPARLRPLVGAGFRLLSGDDTTAAAFITQGGDGCISVTSNVAPDLCRTLYLRRRHGARAQALSELLAQLTSALSRETNPGPLKYALSVLGLMSATMRLPLVEPSLQTRREIDAALARVAVCSPDYLVADARRRAETAHAAAE